MSVGKINQSMGLDPLFLKLESGSKLRLGFFQKNIARHVYRLSGI